MRPHPGRSRNPTFISAVLIATGLAPRGVLPLQQETAQLPAVRTLLPHPAQDGHIVVLIQGTASEMLVQMCRYFLPVFKGTVALIAFG